MWNYVVTAQKPTAVTHSVVGRFTGPNDINLILSKGTRIEIHLLAPEGLTPMLDVGIYGRIATMELFRPPGESQDHLFISTEKQKFCVIAYDSRSGDIVTKGNGEMHDPNGRPADVGSISTVDPDIRCIALHLYDGSLKVIPIDPKGHLKEAFNLRLEELQVIDVKFLYGCKVPTIAILYQDTKEARHVKTYEIDLKDRELKEGPWAFSNADRGATILVPLPGGGALIVGEQTLTYHGSGQYVKTVRIKTAIIKAVGKLDMSRYLMGDHQGNLTVIVLDMDNSGRVTDIKTESLGETSISSTINYLDNNFVFIGSTYGDSQLIRLNAEKNEQDSYLELVDHFDNLGPIVDFCVIDLDRQGQGQVVTCSGAFKDGSIRVIRNGIGIHEQATVDLEGIKGLWSLRPSLGTAHDKYIILSFVSETRVLAFNNDELEETEIEGFSMNEQTVFCSNVVNNQLIQVTRQGVFLVSADTLKLVSKWSPPDNLKINVASGNATQLLLGTTGGNLVYLTIEGSEIKQVSHRTLEYEISSVNINSLNGDGAAHICAVGMWTDISVRLLSLPNLDLLTTEKLGGEILPRSVLLVNLEGINYLLCGLGDGFLFSFVIQMEDFHLYDKKKLSLGTQPLILNTFRTNNQTNIFVASDRPTVIYSNNKKLLYSNVNLKEVNYISPFHSESFPDSLALATEGALTIGTIDEIQKLHIRTIPLKEMPRRISHQESSSSFGVLTVNISSSSNGEETESGYLHLLDDKTFEKKHTFPLQQYESPCSIVSCKLKDDPIEYFVVGTAFAIPTESEPNKGRLLVLQVVDDSLKLISETETKGAVYSLDIFNGKILAGVNSRVQIFTWTEEKEGAAPSLTLECAHQGHILALSVIGRGDFIIVGDLMRSISLLIYKTTDNTPVIEEIARDFNPNWMTAVQALDDDTYIGAENSFNLFTVKRNSEAATDEERSKLDVTGLFHLGEFVNKFRHGSLVMKMSETDTHYPTLLYGSVYGAIGVIANIPQDLYQFLLKVQQNLNKVIKGVGGFSHEQWRMFSNERKNSESKGFIDGDLIESYLDLKIEKQREVVKGLDVTTEELTRKIEALQQSLH